jgi:4-amino-4-deoxy-L-arabinose transferase-like glycosyltransferase
VLLPAAGGLLFALLAALYSLSTPLWEAPDEVGHFDYVRHLLTARSLPTMSREQPSAAHQPPLYYALAALAAAPVDLTDRAGAFRLNPRFIWAGNGGQEVNAAIHGTAETFPYHGEALALRLGRAVSVLLGAVTIGLALLIARRLFPARPLIWLVAGALIVFNPQVLFVHGALNNDSLATLASTAALLATLRAADLPCAAPPRPDRAEDPAVGNRVVGWAVVGVALGIGLLAKTTTVAALGAALAVLALVALRRRAPAFALGGAVALGIPVALLTGWWLARNWRLYGDPLGRAVYREVWAVNTRQAPLTLGDLADFAGLTFRSFWGVFGWMNLFLPGWLYGAALALTVLGLLGAVVARSTGRLARGEAAGLAVLGLFGLAQVVVTLALVRECSSSCYQGRYLFPALAPFAVLVAAGLIAPLPVRLAGAVGAGLVVGLGALAVWTPLGLIAPAYPMVPLSQREASALPRNAGQRFGEAFELLGYRSERRPDGLLVTLYWRARATPDFDYSAFVHLIDRADRLVAQKDHAPGEAAGYPPTAWAVGDVVADPHLVPLAAPPGAEQRLRVGLYNWRSGQPLGEAAVLAVDSGTARVP